MTNKTKWDKFKEDALDDNLSDEQVDWLLCDVMDVPQIKRTEACDDAAIKERIANPNEFIVNFPEKVKHRRSCGYCLDRLAKEIKELN